MLMLLVLLIFLLLLSAIGVCKEKLQEGLAAGVGEPTMIEEDPGKKPPAPPAPASDSNPPAPPASESKPPAPESKPPTPAPTPAPAPESKPPAPTPESKPSAPTPAPAPTPTPTPAPTPAPESKPPAPAPTQLSNTQYLSGSGGSNNNYLPPGELSQAFDHLAQTIAGRQVDTERMAALEQRLQQFAAAMEAKQPPSNTNTDTRITGLEQRVQSLGEVVRDVQARTTTLSYDEATKTLQFGAATRFSAMPTGPTGIGFAYTRDGKLFSNPEGNEQKVKSGALK